VLRSEKDTLESVLTMKTSDVKKTLSNELVRIEEEMYDCETDSGSGTSTSRRLRTAASSSRLLHLRARRRPCSSSCLASKDESPNSRCRSVARRTHDHDWYVLHRTYPIIDIKVKIDCWAASIKNSSSR
jgi:hypothetical protein